MFSTSDCVELLVHVLCFIIIQNCYKRPIIVGIRGSATTFSKLGGSTIHFENELKETRG